MTVIGLDDTDSRERGMCTTYVAARIAAQIRREATVSRLLLVRLNPAVEHKTRGNAALAVHTNLDPDRAFELARAEIVAAAEVDDSNTNPGLVVSDANSDANSDIESDARSDADAGAEFGAESDVDDFADTPAGIPDAVARFSRAALWDHLTRDEARARCAEAGYRHEGWKNGRGLVGALAAVGAWWARGGREGDWTHEVISYRERERWGTPRDVDAASVFTAAEGNYPAVWDTIDRTAGEVVCVPHTPGPVLHGIRGDDPDACHAVADAIVSEPVAGRETFLTNQGTDDHLRDGSVSSAENGRGYRLDGTVARGPETHQGGHVFLTIEGGHDGGTDVVATDEVTTDEGTTGRAVTDRPVTGRAATDGVELRCAAFEPTKRFRDRVRALRGGDRITACGEVSDGTLKLEKFAVRGLVGTELVTPTCSDCGRRMESAGRGQGYRCRDCSTNAEGKVERGIDRNLELGWYEVPPTARRHVGRPLVRGGFDAPTHPER